MPSSRNGRFLPFSQTVNNARAVAFHLLRTFAVVTVLAIAIGGLTKLDSTIGWIAFGILAAIGWYHWNAICARWAPIGDVIARHPWSLDDCDHETVLELARLSAPVAGGAIAVRFGIYRLSIYRLGSKGGRRLKKRILIGDAEKVVYLGEVDDCFCFYTDDCYYGDTKASGLSKRSRKTGELEFHLPDTEATYQSHENTIVTLEAITGTNVQGESDSAPGTLQIDLREAGNHAP